MLKHILLFLVGLFVCFFLTNSGFAAASKQETASPSTAVEEKAPLFVPHKLKLKYPDYMLDVQRVKFFSPAYGAFRGSNRLDHFEREAEALLQKWLAKETLLYYDLTVEVCNVLSSGGLGDSIREDKMIIGYARRALAKSRELHAPEIPLDAELSLLRIMVVDPEYFEGKLSGAAWAAHRTEKMALFARGFQRLAAEIDEDHDFSKVLSLQPPFPPGLVESFLNGKDKGGSLVIGMAPSAIKDPKLRAEYEMLIVEHGKELEERNKQGTLRSFNRLFSRWIGQYIVSAYLRPPHNVSEMETFLEKYIKDEEIKRTIRTKYAEGLVKYNEGLQKKEQIISFEQWFVRAFVHRACPTGGQCC